MSMLSDLQLCSSTNIPLPCDVRSIFASSLADAHIVCRSNCQRQAHRDCPTCKPGTGRESLAAGAASHGVTAV